MSEEIVEKVDHIGSDVDDAKEIIINSVLSCDSGIETFDVASNGYSTTSHSDLSLTKFCERPTDLIEGTGSLSPEHEGDSDLSSPVSLSSDDKDNPNIFEHNETLESSIDIQFVQANVNIKNINSFSSTLYSGSNLATSTISLTDNNNKEQIGNSNLSRSAENISITEDNSNSTKDIDPEKILSEFTSQKNKVTATQKVPEAPQILDAKYARLPKELLSQDLGSIVKNVHGIFSSVSGSLKNAYNNSHRVTPKPLMKQIKPITNGKLMNDIFEDVPEEYLHTGPDKLSNEIVNNLNQDTPKSSQDVDNQSKSEMLKLQIESLERVLFEQRKENASLKDRVKQQLDELQTKDQTFKELEAKVDLMCKRAEQAQREKDAAVMRYASTECAVIEAKKAAEVAGKLEKAAVVEKDLMNAKLKTARDEKQRICQLYDDKCHELQTSERELWKMKEELKEVEGRLKWTQSKLRVEMDAYKESSGRAEMLSQQVCELEVAKDSALASAGDSARAKQLETDFNESQAALILCRHEREELERRVTAFTQRLDTCERERNEASGALALATAQVTALSESNALLEREAAELAALRARAALAHALGLQLERETDRASSAEASLSAERARADTCARREAAALQHAAALTHEHVQQQARLEDQHAAVQALSADNQSLRERESSLRTELDAQAERRERESRALARKVAELTEELEEANKKLEWEKGENNVLKKKHSSAIKEINRELQRALKRIDQLEAKVPQDCASNRTGSVSSLSSGDSPEERGNTQTNTLPDVQTREPDRQVLLERIVSLQRAAAARAERHDFLQEHCAHLTRELRAKGRVLRAVLPALPPAGLAAARDEQHKVGGGVHLTRELRAKGRVLRAVLPALPPAGLAAARDEQHKKEIARLGGGAMAAVWGGDPGGVTLELSLEMNRRLQAVLEDTLLKNITLKENMDTLGEEISRLREQMKTEIK